MCAPCAYKAIHLSDPNKLREGFFTCSVCDRLVRIPEQCGFEDKTGFWKEREDIGVANTAAERASIAGSIRQLGKAPKYCSGCSTYMNSQRQSYCLDCRQFLCTSCGNRHSEAGSSRHVIFSVCVDKEGFAVIESLAASQRVNRSRHGVKTYKLIEETLGKPTARLEDMRCEYHPNQPVQFSCMSCESDAICALCCVGDQSAHHSGHEVMDLHGAWARIEFEISGGERSRRQASRDEIQRLTDVCGSVVVHMQHVVGQLSSDLDAAMRLLERDVRECRERSTQSVNDTVRFIIESNLNKAIEDPTIRNTAGYLYGVQSILQSKGLPVVQFYRHWLNLAPIKTPFPIPIHQLQLKCEWLEAMLAKARWTCRWLEEASSLQLTSAKRIVDAITCMTISQQPNRVQKPFYDIPTPITSPPSLQSHPTSIVNPLANENFFIIHPPRPPTIQPSPQPHKPQPKLAQAVKQAMDRAKSATNKHSPNTRQPLEGGAEREEEGEGGEEEEEDEEDEEEDEEDEESSEAEDEDVSSYTSSSAESSLSR